MIEVSQEIKIDNWDILEVKKEVWIDNIGILDKKQYGIVWKLDWIDEKAYKKSSRKSLCKKKGEAWLPNNKWWTLFKV